MRVIARPLLDLELIPTPLDLRHLVLVQLVLVENWLYLLRVYSFHSVTFLPLNGIFLLEFQLEDFIRFWIRVCVDGGRIGCSKNYFRWINFWIGIFSIIFRKQGSLVVKFNGLDQNFGMLISKLQPFLCLRFWLRFGWKIID